MTLSKYLLPAGLAGSIFLAAGLIGKTCYDVATDQNMTKEDREEQKETIGGYCIGTAALTSLFMRYLEYASKRRKDSLDQSTYNYRPENVMDISGAIARQN